MSFCKVTIKGNLGSDPEVQEIPGQNGSKVVRFSVASNSKEGQNQITTWFKCSVWGAKGETIKQYFHKGSNILVTGNLVEKTWTSQQGQTGKSLEVKVDDFDFVDPAPAQQAPAQNGYVQPAQQNGYYPGAAPQQAEPPAHPANYYPGQPPVQQAPAGQPAPYYPQQQQAPQQQPAQPANYYPGAPQPQQQPAQQFPGQQAPAAGQQPGYFQQNTSPVPF